MSYFWDLFPYHYLNVTWASWRLKYHYLDRLVMDNVADYLYLKKGSLIFEVDPHQFNLRLHHFSRFAFNVKKIKSVRGSVIGWRICGSKVAVGISTFQCRSCSIKQHNWLSIYTAHIWYISYPQFRLLLFVKLSLQRYLYHGLSMGGGGWVGGRGGGAWGWVPGGGGGGVIHYDQNKMQITYCGIFIFTETNKKNF